MARKKHVTFKEGFLAPQEHQKAMPPKKGLIQGLNCLKTLWGKNLKPQDLNKHYFLTWFASANGIVSRQAKILRMHRNSIIGISDKIGLGTHTYRFRRMWLGIIRKRPKNQFHFQVNVFYRRAVKYPLFNSRENKYLVWLWLMGFPLKVVSAHYVLWAFRKGLTRQDTAEKLGLNKRTVHRIVTYCSRTGSPAWMWLSPINPQKKDWYPKWALHRD